MDTATLAAHGFRPLTIDQKDLYYSYLGNTEVLDLCFPAMFAYWDKPLYRIIDDVMLVGVNEPDGYLFLPPMGGISAGFEQITQISSAPEIGYMTKAQADVCGIQTKCDKRFSDYIVSRSELTALSWKYKHKLSDYNYFIKHFDYTVIPLTPEFADDCRLLLEHWCAGRSCGECLFGCEKPVLERYLTFMPQNGVIGLVVYSDNRPVGNLIAAKQGDSLFYPYAKTDKSFAGLSVFMYVELAMRSSAQFVNLGSDGGIEGIKRFKDKFRPYALCDKWFTVNKA